MNRLDVSRREFTRLSMAAFGGVVAGATVGCSNGNAPPAPAPDGAQSDASPAEAAASAVSLLLQEPHVCRGLNTCKGKGAGGDNACAGQGACATAEHHACAGHNACKGQGGCGGKEGRNECKEQGGCAVPLAHGWDRVRETFETEMKQAGKDVGPAPDKS